jgi:hypothetical protein
MTSTLELLQPAPAGPIPTAFEVLRDSGRTDWQTVIPKSADERKWYTVGYGFKDDYALDEPMSSTVPVAFRFFWVLGLADAKAGSPPRAMWRKDELTAGGTSWGLLVAGGVLGTLGLTLWAVAARQGDG